MKNKGFTLVELLAVIVVLAIISIITIPMIGNVIDESKKKALEVSASGLVEAASYYTINHDGVYEFVFDENKKGETIKGEQLDYKGNIEETGKLYIDQEGDISLCLVDDKYYVYKNYNSGIYVGEVKDNSCIIGYDVLTNKYVAMLDDGTGQVSNVYSKDEVNNLIDNLQSQINDNTTSINTLSSIVNNNLSNTLTYNAETDYFGITYNGEWHNVLYAGINSYDSLIPNMESNTAPKGTVSGTISKYSTNFDYYMAFKTDAYFLTEPIGNSGSVLSNSGYVTYTFQKPVYIKSGSYEISAIASNHSVTSKMEYQDYDTGEWIDLIPSLVTTTTSDYGFTERSGVLETPVKCSAVRVYIYYNSSYNIYTYFDAGLRNFQVYGKES